MKVNGKEINIDRIVEELNPRGNFLKQRKNGLLLSEEQIKILTQYQIDYLNYANLSSLLFEIDRVLNDQSEMENQELEHIYQELQEIHYYHETNK